MEPTFAAPLPSAPWQEAQNVAKAAASLLRIARSLGGIRRGRNTLQNLRLPQRCRMP